MGVKHRAASTFAFSHKVFMNPQPLICVHDVEASSRWYQRLLGCQSGHGGDHYEQLVSRGQLVMQLHRWDAEHLHGSIGGCGLDWVR